MPGTQAAPCNVAPAHSSVGPRQTPRGDRGDVCSGELVKRWAHLCEDGGSHAASSRALQEPRVGPEARSRHRWPFNSLESMPDWQPAGTAVAGTSGLRQMVHALSPDLWLGPQPLQGNEEAPWATKDTGNLLPAAVRRAGPGAAGATSPTAGARRRRLWTPRCPIVKRVGEGSGRAPAGSRGPETNSVRSTGCGRPHLPSSPRPPPNRPFHRRQRTVTQQGHCQAG